MWLPPHTFLTTKPSTRRMSKSHPELLYILPLDERLNIDLRAKITYTDASTSTITAKAALDLRPGEVQVVNIGFETVNYPAAQPSKTILHIKFFLGTEGDNEELIYYPYTPDSDQSVALYYQNSAGGLDTLICAGDIQHRQSHDSISTVSPLVYDEDWRNLRQYGLAAQRAIAGKSTNVMHRYATRDEVTALRDFDLFREAWIYEDVSGVMDYVPILLTTPIEFPSERNNLVAPVINFQYRFESKAFDRVGL
jgi:hypothetical protein